MLEELIVGHSSPTLAGIKTANMFNYRYTSERALKSELVRSNRLLNKKGVVITVLKQTDKNALIYVYRPAKLRRDLLRPEAVELLTSLGYDSMSVSRCIDTLKERCAECPDFPHEIGVFLGYPIGDVLGFIENKGKCAKCTGCWKVYCDECSAMREFKKLKKCREVYIKHYSCGKSITQLTVAA